MISITHIPTLKQKIEIGNIYKNKSEKEELRELVGDLYWEWDRMSSSGQETLEKIADLLGDREIVEDKYILGRSANGYTNYWYQYRDFR